MHGSVQNKLNLVSHRLRTITDNGPNGDAKKELTEQDGGLISQQRYPAILPQGLIPATKSLGDKFEQLLLPRCQSRDGRSLSRPEVTHDRWVEYGHSHNTSLNRADHGVDVRH